jgi:hypothetical protein
VTETLANITQLVDETIQKIAGRELVSSAEMTDLLLDIRLHLMSIEQHTTV